MYLTFWYSNKLMLQKLREHFRTGFDRTDVQRRAGQGSVPALWGEALLAPKWKVANNFVQYLAAQFDHV